MSVTIEVRDRHGDAISAVVCPITKLVIVTLPDSKPIYVEPDDPDAMAWLKKVFGSKVEYLFL